MPNPEQPLYEELAARNAELTARVAELLAVVAGQAAVIETLQAEVAALRLAGGPGLLELLPAPEPGRPRGEGGEEGWPAGGMAGAAGPAAGRPERPSGCEPGVGRPAG